jgi:hypothetical protein
MDLHWPRWLEILRPKVRQFADTFMANRSQLNQHLISWLPDSARTPVVMLLAHYRTTFEQLQTSLEQAKVPYQIQTGLISPASIDQWYQTRLASLGGDAAVDRRRREESDLGICLALADQLTRLPSAEHDGPSFGNRRRGTELNLARKYKRPVGVLVAERHQSRHADEKIRSFCCSLRLHCELGYFVALDDPLLQGRIDPAMQQLLEHYGMRPNEPLQSMLLERLVRRTQQKAGVV